MTKKYTRRAYGKLCPADIFFLSEDYVTARLHIRYELHCGA